MKHERTRRAFLGTAAILSGVVSGCTSNRDSNEETSSQTTETGRVSVRTASDPPTRTTENSETSSVRTETTSSRDQRVEYDSKKTGRPVVRDPQYATTEETHSGTLLTDSQDIDRLRDNVRDGEIGTFVLDTNFERAYVLILQTELPSAGTYSLESVERTDAETIRAVSVVESTPGPSAETAKTVVARISYSGSTPSNTVVTIRNPSFEQGEQLQFQIDAASD